MKLSRRSMFCLPLLGLAPIKEAAPPFLRGFWARWQRRMSILLDEPKLDMREGYLFTLPEGH